MKDLDIYFVMLLGESEILDINGDIGISRGVKVSKLASQIHYYWIGIRFSQGAHNPGLVQYLSKA